jgi:MFS family permease
LVEGLLATRREPILLTFVVSATIYSMGFQGVMFVGIPALAKQTLGAGDAGVGWLYGASGAGALLGSLVVGALPRLPRAGLVIAFALIGTGAGFALTALAPSLAPAGMLLAFAGAANAVCAILTIATLQARAPVELRGRVMAVFLFGAFGFSPLSVGLGGLIADAFGPRSLFVVGGLAIACAGSYCLTRSACRRLP